MDDLSLDGSQSEASNKSFHSNNSSFHSSSPNPKSRYQKRASLQLEGRSSEAVDLLLATRQAQSNSPKSKSPTAPTFSEKPAQSRTASTDNMSPVPLAKTAFKKKIVGDIFGTNGSQSLAGLMYRSRIITQDALDNGKEDHQEESLLQDSLESSVSVVESDGDSEEESKQLKNMNPKQQLAVTIKNWLAFPENDEMVMEEGAVYALIALSKVDDATIRRCCASSFYKLSSRERNRERLLQTGTAAGVVYITLQSKSIRVARLSAFTLCNLSMQQDGEATMAEENCMLALAALPAMLPSLFPICMQAMYNMTCSKDYFKKVDRIIKALLDFSSVGYDKSEYVIKALVNASRFSWLRLRLIEFGCISHLHTLLPSIPSWGEKKQELVFYILTAIRSLSDSPGCCAEMLQKGSVDILQALIKYSTDKECLLIAKVLHNFLQAPLQMSLSAFSNCIHLLHTMIFRSTFTIILQYCSACLFIVTREKLRGLRDLSVKVIDSMSILLPSTDPLTQYFAISTAGNLFFGNLISDHSKLELLIQYFVNNGRNISDAQGKQALALALAKLSQEGDYLGAIERLGLLDKVLLLLMTLRKEHRNSLELQESCCIAVCRISLRINDGLSPELRMEVASLLLDMLQYDDKYVLSSAVSGLRAMASAGLFPTEVIHSNPFLHKIAALVTKYGRDTDLCRFGCAVLAVFSYDLEAHDLLSESSILQVLFANIRSEDAVTRELVGNTLCNLSLHPDACAKMISVNVVELLGELSSSTSEAILDLCAKCLCNLTCHKDLHREMIRNNVLEILLMISLVRTVSSQTKCTCAKALLNLLTDDNLLDITSSGAIRIFASLASIPFAPVQKVCSKGFHLMTMTATRRRELVKNPAVLHALFNMVKGTVCNSTRVKIRLGISIINLLSCPETNFEAMKVGALSCLKIVATMGQESLRDATARLIVTLASDPKFHPMLLREPVVAMLILILQEHETASTFNVAIFGLSCLSQYDDFKKLLIRDKCIDALIGMTFQGRVTEEKIAREICATYTHLSYVHEQVDSMIQSNAFAVALGVMYSMGLTANFEAKTLVLIMVRNLSESVVARRYLVDEGIFGMLVQTLLQDTMEVQNNGPPNRFDDLETPGIGSLGYAAMIRIVFNLSNMPQLHDALIRSGVMNLFLAMCLPIEYAESMTTDNDKNAASPVSPARSVPNRNIPSIQEYDSSTPTPTAAASALRNEDKKESTSMAVTPTKKRVSIEETKDGGEDSIGDNSIPRSQSRELQISRKFLSMQSIPVSSPAGRRMSEMKEGDESDDNNSVASEGKVRSSRAQTFMSKPRMRPPLPIAPIDAGSSDGTHHVKLTHSRLLFTYEQTNLITQCLHLLSQTPSCHIAMVLDGKIMTLFRALIHADLTPLAKCEVSACLASLAQTKACREPLVQQGAVELLIALSICSDHNTQAQCATALAYLSEITYVSKGVVASLLLLELHLEGTNLGNYNKEELMNLVQSHQTGHNNILLQSRSRDPAALAKENGGSKDTPSSAMRTSLGNMSNLLPTTLSPKNSAGGGENPRASLMTVGSGNSVSNLNAKEMGGSISSSSSVGTMQKFLNSNGGGGEGNSAAIKTLSTSMAELLRDLMKDKRRFDQYIEALQQGNRENLDQNNFYSKPTSSPNTGGNDVSIVGLPNGHYHHHSVSYSVRESLNSNSGVHHHSASSSSGGNHGTSFSLSTEGTGASPSNAASVAAANITPVGGSRGVRALRHKDLRADLTPQHGNLQPLLKLNRAELDLLVRTATHTRLYINFKPHEIYLRSQEVDTLKSHFEDYMYRTPIGQKSGEGSTTSYRTEQGGLSRPLTVEVKLPGIPPDRDLDNENRHKDLIPVPVNKDPLSKDFRPPEQGELVRTATAEKRNTIRLSDGINGLDTVDEESAQTPQQPTQHSPFSQTSRSGGKGKLGGPPSLSSIGRHSSLGDLSKSKSQLDPRSPLMKNNSQIFGAVK